MSERTVHLLQLVSTGTVFFIWAFLLTPFSIRLSERYRIMDAPGGRKQHKGSIPRGSGVVFWVGYLLLALLLFGIIKEIRIIATGATLVFLLGYMDDMKGLSAGGRLIGHFAASLLVVAFAPFPPLLKVLLLFWIAGGISAFNLIDGMNGLALVVFFITTLFGMALGRLLWWVPLGAMALGMFFWNFPVARTFLGDGGSTLLGFLCMSQLSMDCGVLFAKTSVPVLFAVLFLIGGVPFIDTAVSILRRLLSGKSPFTPDRGHIHHRLLDKGVSQTAVLLLLSAAHGLCIAGGYVLLVVAGS